MSNRLCSTLLIMTAEQDVMSPKPVSQSDLNFSFALFSAGLRHAMSTNTSEFSANQCHSPINAAEIFFFYSVPILVTRLYIHVYYITILCACRRYQSSGHVSSTPREWEVFLKAMSL